MKETQFKRPRNLVPSPKNVGTSAVVTETVDQEKVDNPETIAELKQQLLDQAKRHQKRVEELKAEASIVPEYVVGTLEEVKHTGLLVKNSHTFWKWLSTWAFAAIAYVSISGVPPEVLALIPEASQGKVTAAIAILGFIGRFINQSRGK
ncbi:hypothetical protein MN869_14785 [Acinetobacter sp. NIPH1876]|uniref:DUF7940 domain-containing protein n=1 Tax=Acinetobacter sp. NIPH1876 TaxID=2924041 RepID=UPI001FAC999C|nr:hypothetical protein [Acinetobacter sp. NIPH1876]MCJ0829712.1 hypothetical protein [Acinetobacter sp. NIPH1876]